MLKELLTPKQVARAMQVSESSVKRWCDKGLIPTEHTAGGHRRIRLNCLLEFLRAGDHKLVRPEVVGLPATTGRTSRVIDRAAGPFAEALVNGDEEQCRQIVLDLYLAEHSISAICDEVFAKALEAIGTRWECGDAEVYQERRGCEISLRVFHELRQLAPTPPADAPLAMGGSVAGDQYSLANAMVELVLRDAHWKAVSLGNNLPFGTLAVAIRRHQPRLFWLSCSHLLDEATFVDGYASLYEEFGLQVAFVVGGRALTPLIRQKMKYAAYCDNMRHLEAFAQTLRGATAACPPPAGSAPASSAQVS